MKGETNNKRQAKLLAAVAVMAMVVCAFAVSIPAWESDASGSYYGTPVTVDADAEIAVNMPAGLVVTANGNKITAVGEAAMAGTGSVVENTSTFDTIFTSAALGYATAEIIGLNELLPATVTSNITVKQTNSALAIFNGNVSEGDNIVNNNGV